MSSGLKYEIGNIVIFNKTLKRIAPFTVHEGDLAEVINIKQIPLLDGEILIYEYTIQMVGTNRFIALGKLLEIVTELESIDAIQVLDKRVI